jgi:hypothetical protein
MRRRAALLVVLAGALVAAGGVALESRAVAERDAPSRVAALARTELADVPAPTAVSRTRDGSTREHDLRGEVAVALGLALALTLSGAWWIARERTARLHGSRALAPRRTRAPPWMPATVHP